MFDSLSNMTYLDKTAIGQRRYIQPGTENCAANLRIGLGWEQVFQSGCIVRHHWKINKNKYATLCELLEKYIINILVDLY